MNHIETLLAMGIGGAAMTAVNALLWFIQARTERRFRFIGDHGRYSFQRMWLNLALMALFFSAAAAAKWMAA